MTSRQRTTTTTTTAAAASSNRTVHPISKPIRNFCNNTLLPIGIVILLVFDGWKNHSQSLFFCSGFSVDGRSSPGHCHRHETAAKTTLFLRTPFRVPIGLNRTPFCSGRYSRNSHGRWKPLTTTTATPFGSLRSSSRRRNTSTSLFMAYPPRKKRRTDHMNNSDKVNGRNIKAEELGRTELQQYFTFPLDSWQAEAGGEILCGKNVVVCAPTGAGKTVVGEMALHAAFRNGEDAIYTTPLKALSNQKFAELRRIFGRDNVGLSTGDSSVNRGARITVMTTEVYRNMAWRAGGNTDTDFNVNDMIENEETELLVHNELSTVTTVVLDEFHYMGQPGRGGVWEESVITSPSHTRIVCLSATLPNAHRLGQWMEAVTDRKTAFVEAGGMRPVPLRYLFATRDGLESIFRDEDAGPGTRKGLLGLRGDGVKEDGWGGILEEEEDKERRRRTKNKGNKGKNKKKLKQRGKKQSEETFGGGGLLTKGNDDGFPVGLELNPKFQLDAERRQARIDRAIAKKSLEIETQQNSDDDYDDFRPGRRRRQQRRRMTGRDDRRERERLLRSEMRKAVPSVYSLLGYLRRRDLLPAIFFIFSRKGCDEAAETLCRFMELEGQSKRDAKLAAAAMDGDDYADFDDDDDGYNRTRKKKPRGRGKKHDRRRDDPSVTVRDRDGRSFRIQSDYLTEDTLSSILDSVDDVPPSTTSSSSSSNNDENNERYQIYAEHGLLTLPQVIEVAARIKTFNNANPEPEIRFDASITRSYLYGVSSHHAGLLPAHKAFTEFLFQLGLAKVVFATETLAAGINVPARTTVISSMAKRGEDGMRPLDTASLLQMAGRAGRRGMDLEGTCVVAATPFEGPEEAARILTGEVEPVVSQFSPSYSLAVNLVARGEGKLDVANRLVKKSFAMWERRQLDEEIEKEKLDRGDDVVDEAIASEAGEQFLVLLGDYVSTKIENGEAADKLNERVLEVLENRDSLKYESKSFVGLCQMLALENNTLRYLQQEADAASVMDDETNILGLEELFEEDKGGIDSEIETQRIRIQSCEQDISQHIMTDMTRIANSFLAETSPEAEKLRVSLLISRNVSVGNDTPSNPSIVTANELTRFSKAFVTAKRRRRRSNIDDGSLAERLKDAAIVLGDDDSWYDMRGLIGVLTSYGCLLPSGDDPEIEEYGISIAGENVGMLGLENSLWCLVALGGAWDIKWGSAGVDKFRSAMMQFEDTDFTHPKDGGSESSTLRIDPNDTGDTDEGRIRPQIEAAKLVSLLRSLEFCELAGYASCLVADKSKGGSVSEFLAFQNLSPTLQEVIQCSNLAMERFIEVQDKYSVNLNTNRVQLNLIWCDVVIAWASGCTWNEALELSGFVPGDLIRALNRALDVLRQLGNLPINPARSMGVDSVCEETPGIHPDIRRLCREAAQSMDRYPVKDHLPFVNDEISAEESDDDDVIDGDINDDINTDDAIDSTNNGDDDSGFTEIGMDKDSL